MSLCTYLTARVVILREAEQGVNAITQAAAAEVHAFFTQRINEIDIIRRSPLFEDHFKNVEYSLRQEAEVYRVQIEGMLSDFASRTRVYPRVYYLDPSGKTLCLIQDGKAVRAGGTFESPDFLEAVKRMSATGRPLSRTERVQWYGYPILRYGVPILDTHGIARGALIFDCSLSSVHAFLGKLRLGISGRVRLTQRPRRTRAGPFPQWLGKGLIASSIPISGTSWAVIMAVNPREFTDRLTLISTVTLFLSVLASMLVIMIITRQVRLLLIPLEELRSAAKTYASGHLDRRVNVSGPTELAELAQSFNAMAENLRQRTAALIQTEKLTAVGTLIGGIAHELNNPLAAVTGFAELLKDTPRTDEEREDLRHLYESSLRCRDIVQGLFQFVRQEQPVMARVSVNDAIQAALALSEYRLVKGEGIEVVTELDTSHPEIAADFKLLQQVLVNLLNNAVDALRDHSGRKVLWLRSSSTGGNVRIEVEDTGPGIAAGERNKIFEPFFTKKTKKGMGLGLSISAMIVSQFSGSLSCEEGRDRGARFIASFPPCPPGIKVAEALRRTADPRRKGARILVVDDEPDVAQLMLRFLREDGMDVVALTDPEHAKRRLKEDVFDLVIADLDMGPIKGTDLLEQLGGDPRPGFMLVTGDILNDEAKAWASGRNIPVVTKPFLRTDFLRVVHRVLAP
ncbi:MAG: response regulator [Elusimicrobia bacterium]|nr:response regulator [Elusimicrobiota bacterium]